MLILSHAGAISKTAFYAQSDLNIYHRILNITCSGNEQTLLECPYTEEFNDDSTCINSEDAGVICQCENIIIYSILSWTIPNDMYMGVNAKVVASYIGG